MARLKRLVLDSGALSALAAGDPRMRAWVAMATKRQMLLGIPAPVLAETLTGQPADAAVHRVIPAPSSVIDTTRDIGREAGRLRYRAKRPDATIDALVLATAATLPGSILLTGDIADMTALAAELAPTTTIEVRSIS